jgi:hypothetical protein
MLLDARRFFLGADTLQKISDEQHNDLRDGFYAKNAGR